MLDKVIVFGQNSIKFDMDKKIYVDPLQIKENYNDADIIFITHDHYDHFSKEDISKVIKDDTIVVAPKCMEELVSSFKRLKLVDFGNYEVLGISFMTVPAYNLNKKFHPKEKNYVGYVLNLNNVLYYISGDTDNIPEIRNINCDVAFLPIGGTFTMDYKEAFELVKEINPKIVVPVHYGSIVGEKEDGINFKELVDTTKIICSLLIK